MIVKKEIRVKRLEQVDILCDVCGKSCKSKTCPADYEYANLWAQWGYDSRKDGENHSCDLCEDCYDEVILYIEKKLGGKINRNEI
jgi:hypothetical protein